MTRLFAFIASFWPETLPMGTPQHEKWAKAIIGLSGRGVPDNSSTRFALAVMLMHLKPTQDRKPKRFFVKQLRKAAVNEVAHSMAQEWKKKQLEEQKAVQSDQISPT